MDDTRTQPDLLHGRYRLLHEIGRGGMGVVFEAVDERLGHHVAVKGLLRGDDWLKAAFYREAQLLAGLRHLSLPKVSDHFIAKDRPYLVMEYIPGDDLATLLSRRGKPFTVEEVLRWADQLLDALAYLHSRTPPIIHRDIKPGNLKLAREGQIVLLDFGLAKGVPSALQDHAEALSLYGYTAQYAPPEQILGEGTDARSDLYALAATLHTLLAGVPPPSAPERRIALEAGQSDPARPLQLLNPAVPRFVADAVAHALSLDRADRPVGANELRRALQAAADNLAPALAPPTAVPASTVARRLSSAGSAPTGEGRNRARMLEKVRQFWIEGVLEQSLHDAVLIDLGLEARRDAVELPWRVSLMQAAAGDSLPAGTRISDVFDRCGSELLILGAPGAGKTTTLLELAADLLTRAEREPREPMPVIFNLSTWAQRRKPLAHWLVEELNSRYHVPRRLAGEWIESDSVLPLLDGLDEVDLEHRAACVEAINDFRREHGLLGIAVCCRAADYEAIGKRLRLQGAVNVLPLTPGQVERYLAVVGEPLRGLHTALQSDAALRELAETPLMLSIMSLAYRGIPADELKGPDDLARRRQHLFETYIDRMYERRPGTDYSLEQLRGWLTWLARELHQRSLSVFAIEDLQPDWLVTPLLIWLYNAAVGGVLGLATGAVLTSFFSVRQVFVIDGPADLLWSPWVPVVVAAIGGLGLHLARLRELVLRRLRWAEATRLLVRLALSCLAILVAVTLLQRLLAWVISFPLMVLSWLLAGVLVYETLTLVRVPRIVPTESVSWSWGRALRWLPPGVIGGQLLMAWGARTFVSSADLAQSYGGFLVWLALGAITLLGGAASGLFFGIAGGISRKSIGLRTRPNEGIFRSGVNAILTTLLTGTFLSFVLLPLILIALSMIPGVPGARQISEPADLVALFAPDTLLPMAETGFLHLAPVIGLLAGGLACIQHLILRVLLLRRGAPLNLSHALQFATDRLLLRRVGGGFIFVHRLLLEHFAQERPEDSQALLPAEAVRTTQTLAGPSPMSGRSSAKPNAAPAFAVRAAQPGGARPRGASWFTPRAQRLLARLLAAVAGAGITASLLILVINLGLLIAPEPSLVQQMPGAGNMFSSFVLAPDGRTLAVADDAARIALWDIETGARRLDLPPSPHAIPAEPGMALSFDAGGTMLAAGAGDGTVLLWDVTQPTTPQVFGAPVGTVEQLAVDPTGTYIAALGPNQLRIWTAQGELHHTIAPLEEDEFIGGLVSQEQLAFTPDGRELIYLSQRGAIRIWRTADWSLDRTLGIEPLNSFEVAPDGRYLAVSTRTEAGLLLRLSDGSVTATLRQPSLPSIMDFAFDPAGAQVFMLVGDNSLVSWELADLASSRRVKLAGEQARFLKILPDGRAMTISVDGTLNVRRLVDGVVERSHSLQVLSGSWIDQVVLSADQRFLVATPISGEPMLIRLSDLSVQRLPVDGKVAALPDGALLVATSDGALRLYDPKTGSPLREIAVGHNGVAALAFAPDGITLLSAGQGVIRIWDRASGHLLRTLDERNFAFLSGCFAFSPSGRILVSCGSGPTVNIWNTQRWELQRTLESPPLSDEEQQVFTTGLVFDPEEASLVVADSEGRLLHWRLSDGTLINTVQGHRHAIIAMVQGGTPSSIVSIALDRTVKEWVWPDLAPISTSRWHNRPVFGPVAAIPGGDRLVQTGWPDGVIQVVRLGP